MLIGRRATTCADDILNSSANDRGFYVVCNAVDDVFVASSGSKFDVTSSAKIRTSRNK